MRAFPTTKQLVPKMTVCENRITLNDCDHAKCASLFLRDVQKIINSGYKEIILCGSPVRFFPNALVPICGIIEYYKQIGYKFTNNTKKEYLSTCGLFNPLDLSVNDIQSDLYPFGKIFLFRSDEQVNAITQAYVDSLSKRHTCEEGVIDGIQWCISEIMDNVLTHSTCSSGLVMAQVHPNTNHIAFCIYDVGVGIYKTLKSSKYNPSSEIDAISLSIQEGVGDGKGQGNGLYGLYQIVHNNKGTLTITSGRSSLMLKGDGEILKFTDIPFIDADHRETIVDFQLDLNRKINMQEAFRSIGGYSGFDVRIDDMLSFDDEDVHYRILDNTQGTATRQSGLYLRNDIINTFRRTKRCMVLDFSGVRNVSSSFIDEFIAKLVLEFGLVEFTQVFRIIGMNDDIRFLCNRSVYMRIHEAWGNDT